MQVATMNFPLFGRLASRIALVLALVPMTGKMAKADSITTDLVIPYSSTGLFSGNWSGAINGSSIAAASVGGNAGTGITFANWQGKFNVIVPGQTTTFSMSNVRLGSTTTVNTLLNDFYGDTSTDAVVTFINSLGATQSFSLLGGNTIRDYNNYTYQNSLSNSTLDILAQNWWNNGGSGQRLDVQSFKLSSAWAGTSLVSMSIYNPSTTGTQDVLSAAQVVSNPTAVTPEPSSLALLGTGILGVAATIRRRVRR